MVYCYCQVDTWQMCYRQTELDSTFSSLLTDFDVMLAADNKGVAAFSPLCPCYEVELSSCIICSISYGLERFHIFSISYKSGRLAAGPIQYADNMESVLGRGPTVGLI